jgi:hypothetical protein
VPSEAGTPWVATDPAAVLSPTPALPEAWD